MTNHHFATIARIVPVVLLGSIVVATFASAAGPRGLPEGTLPDDHRLGPLTHLNSYFPFTPQPTPEAWQRRAEALRRQMLVSLGLWPEPTRTPLEPVIHGRIEKEGYTVEKVYFQSVPGFFVTGNLYRPIGREGKLPGVLCPHGHWPNGRFYDAGLESVRKQIADGGEKYETGGRSPLQARSVQLARMGCVVFHYDMIGYADSEQIPASLAHRFATQRPEMNTTENWGLFSPQAEAHLQNVMGLQTWNSIRALDFLMQLPDVDAARIGVTGASGGGTQTFILAAVDPRVAVAFPAVMVSTAMQGGCTCENTCGLRIDTGNVEMAALFAPKPLALSAADDWTKEMATKGFPELQQHYRMLGAEDNVSLTSLTQYGHNFNYPSRAAMYVWFNRHLGLGLDEPIVEPDYERLDPSQMTVWNDEHPQPEGGPDFERKLVRWLTDDAAAQYGTLLPRDAASLKTYRDVVGGAVETLLGGLLPTAEQVGFEQTASQQHGTVEQIAGLINRTDERGRKEQLPALLLAPEPWNGHVVIWIDAQGKAGLLNDEGAPRPHIARLLVDGSAVVGVDLLYQGEFLPVGEQPPTKTRRVDNPRQFAGYTFGFNHTLFAQRVRDVLTVVSAVRHSEHDPQRVDLVGLGEAGRWVAAARALTGEAVDRTAIDTGGFRFGGVLDLHDVDFLPGGAKYGDLPGMLALTAPGPLWLAGENAELPAPLRAAYSAAGALDRIHIAGQPPSPPDAAVDWLLQDE